MHLSSSPHSAFPRPAIGHPRSIPRAASLTAGAVAMALLAASCSGAATIPSGQPASASGAPVASAGSIAAAPSGTPPGPGTTPATTASVPPSPGASIGAGASSGSGSTPSTAGASSSAGGPAASSRPWPTPPAGAAPPAGFSLDVPVLMYHRIVPAGLAGDSLPGLVVSPTLFEAQLALLHAHGWHSITAAQLAADLAHGRREPPRTFVITIDDGWDDGYTYALPILRRFGYVATYYVPAGRVDVMRNVLTSSELRTLAADGMEIGNHTYSGDSIELTQLSPAQIRYQIQAGASRLAAIVGQTPVTLAYPAGKYDAAIEALLQADGYDLAVIEGANSYAETWAGRFAVARWRVTPGTTPEALLSSLRALEPGS